ncbi:MAG: DNA-3-methyladenine glycosylase I [Gemmatimonadetes bacterium]|nr:DNA-3-methyladenine glycosylase I [Gemmatimonadota bacterium]MBT5143637.1 DNA-3-methyladenine glycosylase I [Gemmatimonadota bacterium]MBT5586535.1 DNA-3-methyladenine glycosylase I [Gemmatimonadota bacterium]MBT6627400.1 DNA-3-methyladenine glycosylase I [Gemmatimonadota bacterium]MBT7455667.1 DNA-3-methyladenine glycosylase I [Gemmatimonadota bacterium]
MAEPQRCAWAGNDKLMQAYHDEDWGTPLHDDQRLFEFLILEGAQAGLSWSTILNKRDNYRRAFDGFDPVKVAGYSQRKIQALLQDEGIVRNRLKVNAAVRNAKAFLAVVDEVGSWDAYIWSFVDGTPIQNSFRLAADLPAETDLSKILSKDLKKRGFTFVGPTICYALMQATGMVNDHEVGCFRHDQVAKLARKRTAK